MLFLWFDHPLIEAEIVGILKPMGFTPGSERIARELAPLKDQPETLREVWTEAQEKFGPTPTAKQVAETRDSRLAVHFSSDTPEWYTPPAHHHGSHRRARRHRFGPVRGSGPLDSGRPSPHGPPELPRDCARIA